MAKFYSFPDWVMLHCVYVCVYIDIDINIGIYAHTHIYATYTYTYINSLIINITLVISNDNLLMLLKYINYVMYWYYISDYY